MGEVSAVVSRFYFKSNLGKVTLSPNQEVLEFDPVEVDPLVNSVKLIVYCY